MVELDETDAHNMVELADLAHHGSVRLAFKLGIDEITHTLVETLEGEDLRVLQEANILCMTDSLMQPILWYDAFLCCIDYSTFGQFCVDF